jgi:hypothetical protein
VNRRLILAGVAGATMLGPVVLGTVVPALAKPSLPVSVTVTPQDGGVYVATAAGNQPLVGAGTTANGVCVVFSEEIPTCVPVRPNTANTRQSLPGGGVVVYHDDTRTAVGVGYLGVVIYSNGRICPVVSTQDWPCVQATLS